ncbi:hypothetical protein SEVIR_4G217600v4 [Setaria viridis]|uniref:Phytosulfokine-alpha n=1 Tax=Setaria viridis TaxID=4556 RepID=A0A4U6V2K8_SETVI|nr:phytosulfokines 1-like [Setaria viridis]TKW22265.1 hypothetical protein SEVIR_4G217600v2 [Setaria viridis]
MMHGRRTAAMAVACLLCMAVALLLAQGVQSRKLLWTGQEEQDPGSLGSSHGAGTAATPEPCGGGGARGSAGSRGSAGTGEARCETARWAEMHTDYIYTQDVKHP